VFKVIEDHPGLRSEEIYKKLPLAPELTKKVLAKLREGKRVKTTGEKRAMTYAAA
jgi:transcription initiation factor IIE alpha subunit